MTRPARLIALLIVVVLGREGAPRAERPAAGKTVKPTIAVLYFDYGGKKAELEPLREGLAQMLITDLADLPEIRVVERTRLKAVLEEHKLAASGKVDAASAARVGKLLGAHALVLGSFFDLAGTLRVDARVVEVETGKIRALGRRERAGRRFLGPRAQSRRQARGHDAHRAARRLRARGAASAEAAAPEDWPRARP